MATERVHVEGFGTLLKRGGRWSIRYQANGKRCEESAHSADIEEARTLLRQRIEQLGQKKRINPTREHRVTMRELFDSVVQDYKQHELKSGDSVGYRLKHLRPVFDHLRAVDVTGATIKAYIKARLAAKASKATINRELSVLHRAFALGAEDDLLSSAPTIRHLPEENVREGFLLRPDFDNVREQLPEDLRDYVLAAYITGTRKSELAALEWKSVNLDGGWIDFPRAETKNKKPRRVPLVGELAELMTRRWEARKVGDSICSLVFHRDGRPIRDFRDSWFSACKALGFIEPKRDKEGRPVLDRKGRPMMQASIRFHDLRRSAVSNAVASGVDQKSAMQLSGHKTITVFLRYNITSDEAMREALQKIEARSKAQKSNVVQLRAKEA